jgi:hypothetical protein
MNPMKLSAFTQFIANVCMALDAGYDVPLAEMRTHIERGDVIPFLTHMCFADSALMAQLFREHWVVQTEYELVELLRDASGDERLARGFRRSGMCYLIALTARLIGRRSFRA